MHRVVRDQWKEVYNDLIMNAYAEYLIFKQERLLYIYSKTK